MRLEQGKAWVIAVALAAVIYVAFYYAGHKIAKRGAEAEAAALSTKHSTGAHEPDSGHGEEAKAHGEVAKAHGEEAKAYGEEAKAHGGMKLAAKSHDLGGEALDAQHAANEHSGAEPAQHAAEPAQHAAAQVSVPARAHGDSAKASTAKSSVEEGGGNEPSEHPAHVWGYRGARGAKNWSHLDPAYETCESGKRQSPIDILGTKSAHEMRPLEFMYQPTIIALKHNGHTVQADYEYGNYLRADGKEWDLVQFHFHTPSEHHVDGKPFDLELHLVHKNREGALAVVGILLQEGSANRMLDVIWPHLPKREGASSRPLSFDLREVLPSSQSYYTYPGSLTTPPCSEGVTWFVLKSPIRVSPAQIDAFSRIIPYNSRPTQPHHGRSVRSSGRQALAH